VVDPNEINPELGSQEDFQHLLQDLKDNGMQWIQDVVPNHMAFDHQNESLMDVLENGPRSKYFNFFDVDWEHVYENIKGRVLAPFLGRFYGESLEDGEITLHYGREGLTVRYYDLAFPLRIDTYPSFFSHGLGQLKRKLEEGHPDFVKLLGVLYVLRTLTSEEAAEDYDHQVQFVKRMLWELYSRNPSFKTFVMDNLRTFNGERGMPDSFALLDDLLSRQFFRLSFWKIATKEINYRRFFNINELISLRVEEPAVLNHTHRLVFDLIKAEKISGLRIDHVDGLHDPAQYLERVRERAPEAYILVEKILQLDEDLPGGWPVQGTTGYDFLNYVNGLFCDERSERAFRRIYVEYTGSKIDFDDLLRDKKRLMILEYMAGDINNLAQLLKNVSSSDRHGLDLTLYGLRRALTQVLAAFPVYRTYIRDGILSHSDREHIQAAIGQAVNDNPALSHELKFIKRFLLMELPAYLSEEHKADWLRVVMRFQQMTGPLMAKGFEDTALYVYNRLISLNDVGGRPDRFGCSVKKFHSFNQKRQSQWPDSLNATSTHDAKRGEDVRAIINVLSEIPEEWHGKIKLWSKLNVGKKKRSKGRNVPDRNDEYFLYQTLLGSFPFRESDYPEFLGRIKEYVIKSVREAKIHTEWIRPDEEYEQAYVAFVDALLDPSDENLFLRDFLQFRRKISHYGLINGLSQTLIKITSPGVPDFYQGTDLWDLNLVDPDNRRSVDFELRKGLLVEIRNQARSDILGLISELLAAGEDGGVKLFLIARSLAARASNAALFRKGRYIPLDAAGKCARHIVAFARQHGNSWSLTLVPRFLTSLVQPGGWPLSRHVWADTRIILPEGAPYRWLNTLTDQPLFTDGSLVVAEALEHFPTALFLHLKNDEYGCPEPQRPGHTRGHGGSRNGVSRDLSRAV